LLPKYGEFPKKKNLCSPVTCSQIWLSPLLNDCHFTYLKKIGKKNPGLARAVNQQAMQDGWMVCGQETNLHWIFFPVANHGDYELTIHM
jgi:hypothetical protein